MTREILSSLFAEKSKYSEYFLMWYFFIQAKAITSMIRIVKTPPKKTPADEEEVAGVSGQLAGGLVLSEVVLQLWAMAGSVMADGWLADDKLAGGGLADDRLADGGVADCWLSDGWLANCWLADGRLADCWLADC